MDRDEAAKKIAAYKPKENFLLVELDWETKLIFPFKDGLTFMSCLINAEILKDRSDKQAISEFKRDAVKTTAMSYSEYVRIKMATLMGVHPKELLEEPT